MSGGKYILDTNVVLYILGGRLKPADIPRGDYCISFITELELLCYRGLSVAESAVIAGYISAATVIGINSDIKQKTIAICRRRRIKLPDAIICATAQSLEARLLTNDKGLKSLENVIVL